MKKILLVTASLVFVSQANADVFEDYQAKGNVILEMSLNNPEKTEEISENLLALIQDGYTIMNLYVVKYPECAEQFAQVVAADSTMAEMSYEDLDVGYHDGAALVEAPKTCYIGRSLVVHPYQIRALAKANSIAENIEIIEHELDEVIVRAGKIKGRLGL